jgi:hypothetical protein
MSALTVTLGADITALKRAMAGATELVAASAKKMASLTAPGLKVVLSVSSSMRVRLSLISN